MTDALVAQVINKLTNRADLNHLVKDRGRGLQRGVLNIIELEETGKVSLTSAALLLSKTTLSTHRSRS